MCKSRVFIPQYLDEKVLKPNDNTNIYRIYLLIPGFINIPEKNKLIRIDTPIIRPYSTNFNKLLKIS